MLEGIAWSCVGAGFLVIMLGAFWLGRDEKDLRDKVKDALVEAQSALTTAATPTATGTGAGGGFQQQAAVANGAAEFVKGLAEFAKSLSGLTQAIQAFLIAALLFFLAASLAVAHAVDTSDTSSTSSTSTTTSTTTTAMAGTGTTLCPAQALNPTLPCTR